MPAGNPLILNWSGSSVAPALMATTIKLEFSNRYPPDEDLPERAVAPAGWGDSLLGGYYSETLMGLYKHEIKVRGPFIMRRVVTTDTLTSQ